MRIIILTLLFLAPMYYFRKTESVPRPETDSIMVKSSAPERVAPEPERLLTMEVPDEFESSPAIIPESREEVSVVPDFEHIEEIGIGDFEEGWNKELKDMLSRLEPMDAEEIHRSYLQELENYQNELNILLDEKQQKETSLEAQEIEYMIGDLDHRHQGKLREILGAHYEAVRDHYGYFMEMAAARP